jgi:hypothetical protein
MGAKKTTRLTNSKGSKIKAFAALPGYCSGPDLVERPVELTPGWSPLETTIRWLRMPPCCSNKTTIKGRVAAVGIEHHLGLRRRRSPAAAIRIGTPVGYM